MINLPSRYPEKNVVVAWLDQIGLREWASRPAQVRVSLGAIGRSDELDDSDAD
jgi:hypothetical protein